MLLTQHPEVVADLDLVATVPRTTYLPPELTITDYPRRVTTYDGFTVAGRAWGSHLAGSRVEVRVAGVTRYAQVYDGRWSVRFEDGALPGRFLGTQPITARITDGYRNLAQSSEFLVVDAFEDGFVAVDSYHQIVGDQLIASGELALGTHGEAGRELVVLLVRDDAEGVVVATGSVAPGWHYGEWRASLPLPASGNYRVRAQLMDAGCPSLTRLASGPSIAL